MKRCPTCRRTYSDDTLRFCLEDGTALVPEGPLNDAATLLLDSAGTEPPPTEILPIDSAPTVRAYDMDATMRRRQPVPTSKQQARPTINEFQNVSATPTATGPRRSTASVVAITVVATILLLGLGGLGAWLILKDRNSSASSVNSNTSTSNSNPGSNSSNLNKQPVIVSTPNATPSATPLQTATPMTTPTATPTPADTSAVRREVMNTLNGWVETMRAGNLDAHMGYYANTLHTYYLKSNVSSSYVRSAIAPAFAKYTSFDVRLTNVQIEVDPTGEKAVATFDKTFTFSGNGTYSGSGLNRFWFEKFGSRWLITGEKDLKTYYVNK